MFKIMYDVWSPTGPRRGLAPEYDQRAVMSLERMSQFSLSIGLFWPHDL
jgi:hypothetical protein